MGFNDKMDNLIKELTFEQNIAFALACINRLKHLPCIFVNSKTYEIYLNKIIPKNKVENVLNEIIKKINTKPLEIKHNEIEKKIKLLKKLLIDNEIDNSIASQIFIYYIIIITRTLEYIISNNHNEILRCSNAVVEIINQTEYEKYNKENKNSDDDKAINHVDIMIDNELEKQEHIIGLIKTGNMQTLDEYIKGNKIEYKV
jgi:hypothetical protein